MAVAFIIKSLPIKIQKLFKNYYGNIYVFKQNKNLTKIFKIATKSIKYSFSENTWLSHSIFIYFVIIFYRH